MSVLILRIMLLIGIVGHGINMYCDRILSVFDKGMITLKDLTTFGQDDRMAVLMANTPVSLPMRSTILGAFAVWMELFGYSAIAYYMYQQDVIIGCILFVCLSCYGVIGAAHHVKYGIVEWIFVRLNRDAQAKQVMVDLYKSGPVTKICYIGYLVYIFTCIFAIFTGIAHLPIWTAIFTILPIFIILVPFRIIGTLHISAIITFVGWILILGL